MTYALCIIFYCIHKTWWRSKGTILISTHVHVYVPQDVCRKITTSMQDNSSDQLLYRGLYVSANELYEEQRLTDSQACRNSTTSMLTLDASERLYQPISLITFCYLHVENNILYITLVKI